MLEARQLACVRGDRPLFRGIAFTLERGKALRVAGANGAGKTSLLRMLCGLVLPAAGDVLWQGEDIRKLREDYHRQLLYIGHASALKDDLTATENLIVCAALAGTHLSRPTAHHALRQIGLDAREDLPAKLLSQGQRRRVALARLLVEPGPPLWILDEPFNALDRRATQLLGELLSARVREGGILVLTTHQEATIPSLPVQLVDLDRPC